MTRYYYVWVRSDRFRGKEALTYSFDSALKPGSIVVVPLKSEQVLGFVAAETSKPVFRVKPITRMLPLPPLPKTNLALAEWIQQFYASPIGSITPLFLPAGLLNSQPLSPAVVATPLPPVPDITWTSEQKHALQIIQQPDTYLLHGRTGSGKTRIYLELARRSLTAGRSVIVLSPEIGLTSQLAAQFQAAYGQRVIVLHSQLTVKQRLQRWLAILHATTPIVVVGPRSALFSPVADIGLIVVDEAHDSAYKQEQAPYYHAVRAAGKLRALCNAVLVLGSATPSIGDYYLAETAHKPIVRLPHFALSRPSVRSDTTIIDLKDRGQFVRSPHLSLRLIQSIAASLERGEQALLYLNRRGTARVTLCDNCGWQAHCPRCDLPLAYHSDTFRLLCHTCGYHQAPFLTCPVCGSTSITMRSFGTKAIVEEVQALFPAARIMRFDTDSTKSERLEQQYDAVVQGATDILVGTQMLSKGLDLPKLSTLGVVLADSSLYLPDYTARERTYQLLTQVMGRIGRGHVAGQTIVQTYYPDSPLLESAMHDNWDEFYAAELAERKTYGFPPFCYILKASTARKSRTGAERAARALMLLLEQTALPIHIDGPAPAFHEKHGNTFRWQLIIKAKNRKHLLEVVEHLPAGWTYDLDPIDLL